MNEVKEYWIDIPNKYIMEMKPDFIHAKYYIHVVEASSYQSLQEKYEKLQSRVKELSEENEMLKSALTPLLETMDFIQRNHNVMNVNAHAKLAIEKFDKALSGEDEK